VAIIDEDFNDKLNADPTGFDVIALDSIVDSESKSVTDAATRGSYINILLVLFNILFSKV
jgi:hypothetical protein